jgi:predicted transcriptional regulator
MTETKTQNAFDLHALKVARASEPLTHSQKRAIDLYKRGFNVFPLPYKSKEPFEHAPLKRLFNSRLHLCGDGAESCRHGKGVPTFASLFTGLKNVGVMCGKTSRNLLAVDCDTHAAYTEMGKELDALGLPYWTFTSHRGGCYLLRVIEGEAANVPKSASSKFNDVELWGHSHYVLVPMSLHPEGTFYQWRGNGEPADHFTNDYETLPAVSVTVLDWLGVTLLKDSKPQAKPFEMFGLSAEYSVLSMRNRETLAHGAKDGERYIRLAALAYDMKANNLEHEDVEADFLHAAELCDPAYGDRKAIAILKSAYSKQRTRARKDTNSGEASAHVQRLNMFVNSFDWKAAFKRKARTRRAVFVACVERSDIEGATFRASVRELGETVNRSFQYMNICLRDLCNAGLLRLITSWNNSGSGANVYAFGETVKDYSEKATVSYTCNNNVAFSLYEKVPNSDERKDVFGLKGLGAVAEEVLKALQAKKYKSVYAVAKDTGAAWSSVNSAVKRLVAHGLAIHSEAEGLYYAEAVTELDLLKLSVKLATNGRAEMQRITHDIDREIFVTRSLSKVMAAYNDVTCEKRESVTVSMVDKMGQKNVTKQRNEPPTKQPEKAQAKPKTEPQADKLLTADFEKILTAYREKMGDPSGAIKDILKDWQRQTYRFILVCACEEDADGDAFYNSPDPLREWEKRRHEVKLDEDAKRPLPFEDGWAFPVKELFDGYDAIGAKLHAYKATGATLDNDAVRFIWREMNTCEGWIISETLREMKKRSGTIRKPKAYMKKVVASKREEDLQEFEGEEDE